MAKNELTSKRISTIASKVLREVGGLYEDVAPVYVMSVNSDLFLIGTSGKGRYLTAGDLRALAASALTQTADKPKRKRTKNVKRSKWMSEKIIEKVNDSPTVDVKSPTDQTPVFKPNENDGGSVVEQMKRVYRAKPLIVSACPSADGWTVEHGGMTLTLTNKQFTGMYEVLDIGGDVIDAGLPDLDPGSEIEKDGKRLVRVTVHAGNGAIAYWKDMRRFGGECEYKVTADNVDNHQASHRVGRFVEPWVGKSGERTWVVVER